jgi:hypothetical protein
MGKRYIHNDTERVVFHGGVMIPPGEGREVEAEFLPAEEGSAAPAADAAPDLAANLREMLDQPLKTLLPLLPECSDETLAELVHLEADKPEPRKTLLGAIGELQLERAKAKTGAPA